MYEALQLFADREASAVYRVPPSLESQKDLPPQARYLLWEAGLLAPEGEAAAPQAPKEEPATH